MDLSPISSSLLPSPPSARMDDAAALQQSASNAGAAGSAGAQPPHRDATLVRVEEQGIEGAKSESSSSEDTARARKGLLGRASPRLSSIEWPTGAPHFTPNMHNECRMRLPGVMHARCFDLLLLLAINHVGFQRYHSPKGSEECIAPSDPLAFSWAQARMQHLADQNIVSVGLVRRQAAAPALPHHCRPVSLMSTMTWRQRKWCACGTLGLEGPI